MLDLVKGFRTAYFIDHKEINPQSATCIAKAGIIG